MPTMKISTKCMCFFQLIVLRLHPRFTRHVRKKNLQNHLHFTRLKIRKSADPQCGTLYPVQISINKRHTVLLSTLYMLNSGGEHHCRPPVQILGDVFLHSPAIYACD